MGAAPRPTNTAAPYRDHGLGYKVEQTKSKMKIFCARNAVFVPIKVTYGSFCLQIFISLAGKQQSPAFLLSHSGPQDCHFLQNAVK